MNRNKNKNLNFNIGIDLTINLSFKGEFYFFHILRIAPGIKYYSFTLLGWRKINEYPKALFYVGRWEVEQNNFQINLSTFWNIPVFLFRLFFPYKDKFSDRVKWPVKPGIR